MQAMKLPILTISPSVRFDLFQGPFTFDDSFIVSPFTDTFQYIPNVPYNYTTNLQNLLDHGSVYKRDTLQNRDFGFDPMHLMDRDTCIDPPVTRDHLSKRSCTSSPPSLITTPTNTPSQSPAAASSAANPPPPTPRATPQPTTSAPTATTQSISPSPTTRNPTTSKQTSPFPLTAPSPKPSTSSSSTTLLAAWSCFCSRVGMRV